MVSPRKLINNLENNLKYKPFDEAALKKLKNDLQPYLKDKDLISLRLLIQKTESCSIDEIENIIFTNLSLFKPLTQHRIRDFVRRRIRKDRISTVEGNAIYPSDDSNLVSPYSRDSFSSTSDMNLSPDSLQNLKLEISNLWQYAMFQKEICQLLWNKDDLEISSSNKITINFENLKATTLMALKELINAKNKQLKTYLSNENIKILHDAFMNGTLSDENISEIYKVIRKREQIPVNENRTFSIDVALLKPETVKDLIRLMCPSVKIEKNKEPIKRQFGSLQNASQTASSAFPTMKSNQNKTTPPESQPQSQFTIDKLRYLSNKIKECTKNETISDIIRIINEHEDMDQHSGSFNVKKMKDITLYKLFQFIESNKI